MLFVANQRRTREPVPARVRGRGWYPLVGGARRPVQWATESWVILSAAGNGRVTLGRTVGVDREVSSGLTAGERVVLSPPPALADGAAVKIADGGR